MFAFPTGAGFIRARCSGRFRCRCSHSGVGSPNSEGALWKQCFVKNGVRGSKGNVVGGVHESPAFSSGGISQVGH